MSYLLETSFSIAIALRRQLDVDLLEYMVSQIRRLKVALSTTNILSAKRHCEELMVSLLILDATYPNNRSLEIGSELVLNKNVKQLLLLDDCPRSYRARAATTFTAAYVSRNTRCVNLLHQIERLATNGMIEPSNRNGLVEHGSHFRSDWPGGCKLSTREIEVMTLLTEGATLRRCAEIMGLAESTVDNHKARLMKKLKIHKSVDLVRLAVRTGLIEA